MYKIYATFGVITILTGVSIAIMGGDDRQLEVIKQFTELDASLYLIGFDDLKVTSNGVLKSEWHNEICRQMDAIILPVVGTDEYGTISSNFSNQPILFTENHISCLPKHTKIYTGLAKTYLKQLTEKHQVPLIELFERDDIAIFNSVPTTEGAIMMAIQHTDFTIHRSTTMVLGLGRTGTTLAKSLHALGATVKVGVRKAEHFARAWEMGFTPFYLNDLLHESSNIDLLFNTIPNMIITSQIIANLPQHAVIIDLASKPGGTDFRFAEKRGIKAMLAPGLPGIVAPKTAGRMIAHTLSSLILEDFKERQGEL